ncbi:MAG: hypothetical protein WC979_06740 [Candidatus Pacearchaeota archaeon]|jgi:chromosome segregation ATPase
MNRFHKTLIAGAGVLALFASGYTGYKYHEELNPPVINTVVDSSLRFQNEELTKQIDQLKTDYSSLNIEKIKADTQTARAEEREAHARKDLAMKPYELEKTNKALEARVSILEGEKTSHSAIDAATKAKYEVKIAEIELRIAQKDKSIAGLEAQIAVNGAREEWFKAQYEKVLAQERTYRAKLEKKLIETGIEYRNIRN